MFTNEGNDARNGSSDGTGAVDDGGDGEEGERNAARVKGAAGSEGGQQKRSVHCSRHHNICFHAPFLNKKLFPAWLPFRSFGFVA